MIESDIVSGTHQMGNLTAQHVDVEKGSHGIIILIDPRDRETWKYATSMVKSLPSNIPVLLVVSRKVKFSF